MQETDDTQKAILGITWVESGISVENILTSCQNTAIMQILTLCQ